MHYKKLNCRCHLQLAHACFGIMLNDVTGLCFNVCGLDTSHALNVDVSDLDARIKWHIPSSLLYACLYWDDHLAKVSFSEELCKCIAKLFEEKLVAKASVQTTTNKERRVDDTQLPEEQTEVDAE
jgi:hypothetical protein